jgi:hypothetical protein
MGDMADQHFEGYIDDLVRREEKQKIAEQRSCWTCVNLDDEKDDACDSCGKNYANYKQAAEFAGEKNESGVQIW